MGGQIHEIVVSDHPSGKRAEVLMITAAREVQIGFPCDFFFFLIFVNILCIRTLWKFTELWELEGSSGDPLVQPPPKAGSLQ